MNKFAYLFGAEMAKLSSLVPGLGRTLSEMVPEASAIGRSFGAPATSRLTGLAKLKALARPVNPVEAMGHIPPSGLSLAPQMKAPMASRLTGMNKLKALTQQGIEHTDVNAYPTLKGYLP